MKDARQPTADRELRGPLQGVLQDVVPHGVAEKVYRLSIKALAFSAREAPCTEEIVPKFEEAPSKGITGHLGVSMVGIVGPVRDFPVA